MCQKCGKSSCSNCDSNSLANLADQIATLQGNINILLGLTKWLKGHPTIWIEDEADIAMFDMSTGWGSANWIGWAIENGTDYASPSGTIHTRDLSDRFLTMIGGTYTTIGETGGENFHTLVLAEIPPITPTVDDPGHTHNITDPGHTHVVDDPGHVHVATTPDHQHSFTTNAGGGFTHNHTVSDLYQNTIWVIVVAGVAKSGSGSPPTGVNIADQSTQTATETTTSYTRPDFTLDGTTDMATLTITVASSTTGVTIESAATGVTVNGAMTGISIEAFGGGLQHENRPPYIAGLFVKKIF